MRIVADDEDGDADFENCVALLLATGRSVLRQYFLFRGHKVNGRRTPHPATVVTREDRGDRFGARGEFPPVQRWRLENNGRCRPTTARWRRQPRLRVSASTHSFFCRRKSLGDYIWTSACHLSIPLLPP
ncbi:hypothetical protein AV530_012475 [Patagioenas fasciata monilis]|uniref:Uncharacterized protein n=1 Tax=Patagioenas fasciata monilis TaxID=372326 RepID=A0A1V4JB36_PATFA|nr:hypothetical protein AV530_012475 [Patagioenas fasciata monilis]